MPCDASLEKKAGMLRLGVPASGEDIFTFASGTTSVACSPKQNKIHAPLSTWSETKLVRVRVRNLSACVCCVCVCCVCERVCLRLRVLFAMFDAATYTGPGTPVQPAKQRNIKTWHPRSLLDLVV